MQILYSRFDAVKVLLRQINAHIKVIGYQWSAVKYASNTPHDNELHLVLAQPRKKRLVILRHRNSAFVGIQGQNSEPVDVRSAVRRAFGPRRFRSTTCQYPPPLP